MIIRKLNESEENVVFDGDFIKAVVGEDDRDSKLVLKVSEVSAFKSSEFRDEVEEASDALMMG